MPIQPAKIALLGGDEEENPRRRPSYVPRAEQNRLWGYAWTLVTAGMNLLVVVLTGAISKNGDIPPYTQNFVRCVAAALSVGVIAAVRGDQVFPERQGVRACLVFGWADWFFLWGYVKSLLFITVLQYTALANGLGPAVSALMSFVFLGEGIDKYKAFVLVRNLTLAMLIVNPFDAIADGSISIPELTQGFLWALVCMCGTGSMRIVQRSNDMMPGVVLMFWGYALNALLWFPPGCIPPKIRMPFLWPSQPQDKYDLFKTPFETWALMSFSGIFGASIMLAQGQALKHLDVCTFAVIVTPLGLVLSVAYSAIRQPLGWYVWVGLLIQTLSMFADVWREKKLSSR